MSDLNDERTESQEQRKVAEMALAEQLGTLSDYLAGELGEDVSVRAEGDAVIVGLSDRGTLILRRGAPVDAGGIEQETVDRISLDEKAQSELDAVYRLLDQLDAIDIRSRGPNRNQPRRP
jgi:hypothetical protein